MPDNADIELAITWFRDGKRTIRMPIDQSGDFLEMDVPLGTDTGLQRALNALRDLLARPLMEAYQEMRGRANPNCRRRPPRKDQR